MKLLSKFLFQSSPKYRAVLAMDLELDLQKGYIGNHEVVTDDGQLLGSLKDDILTIYVGYASDLCSPGFCLFGRWFGTPSKGMELPAFLHDFARQAMDLPCIPWDRKGSDDLFYDAGKMVGRGIKIKIYHGAVAGFFGDIWIKLNKPATSIYCRTIHPKPL